MFLFAFAALPGCGPVAEPVPSERATSSTATEPAASTRPGTSASDGETEVSWEARIVMLGDSLTAGLGVSSDQAYPALVEAELRQEGWPVRVINAGVSGDTSAGGRTRIDWLLQQRPMMVVVALGANDGLRGLPVDALEENISEIIDASREAGARVLLLGMKVPPNYGKEYADRFEAVYPRLAEAFDVPLMPFMLDSVGGRTELNQADGIHPTPAGHRAIAADLMPYLERELHDALPESEEGGVSEDGGLKGAT